MLRRTVVILAAAAAIVAVAFIASCGGGKSPAYGVTSPPGPKELNSGSIAPGGAFAHKFVNAGTYGYHCSFHAVMSGLKVIVDASAPAADTVAAVSIIGTSAPPGFSPASLTIRPGGVVTWTNNDTGIYGMAHTVTSD